MPYELDNLADTVRRAGSDQADAVALISGDPMSDSAQSAPSGSRITWGELDHRVDAIAAALRGFGLPASDGAPARVAIALPNVPEFAETYFGTLRAGLVAVPINPGYTTRELRHLLADSGASVLVTTGTETVDPIRDDLPALRHIHVIGDEPLAGSGTGQEPTTGGEDLAVLLYTSGTAGQPKGAMLSHRALLANHRQLARVDPPIIGPDDVVLLALPLFHVFGLNAGLGAVAYHGATGVLVERFDPAATLVAIARHQVSVVSAVPQMFHAWTGTPGLGDQLTSVRVAVSGAAPLDPDVARRFLDATRHPVFEGYGLTETSPVVASGLASPAPKMRSIGRPVPGVEVRLVAADGTEIAQLNTDGLRDPEAVSSGDDFTEYGEYDDDVVSTDPGEIVVRGENLFSGYWPRGVDGPDADGWWPTGDVAYADADGDLFLVDRLGELIIVSGFNVYPHEVEQVLAAHPAVAEAAVVGAPDPVTGQAVHAFVVAVEGGSVPEADLRAHCERNLARFKCPTTYEFVLELPHSATGKVRKGTLRGSR